MRQTRELIIEPNKPLSHFWRELLEYKDLFYFLAWRDFKVRYKQTIIGVVWAVLRPFLTMVVFTIVFGRIANLPSEGEAPYAIMVFAAMLPWYFFATTLQESSMSIVNNASMVSKIYFPRIIIPVAPMFVNAIDFIISFGILIAMMVWYQFIPDLKIVFLPLFLLLAVIASLGIGFWISALNVKYRDFRYVVPFIVQIGLYVSPVGFSSSIISEQWRLIYSLNPMVGVIDGFRWAILGKEATLYLPGFSLSIIIAVVLFATGIWYFNKTERKFADII